MRFSENSPSKSPVSEIYVSREMNRSSLSFRHRPRLSQRDAIIVLAKAKIKDADSQNFVIMRAQVFIIRHSFSITRRIISAGFVLRVRANSIELFLKSSALP